MRHSRWGLVGVSIGALVAAYGCGGNDVAESPAPLSTSSAGASGSSSGGASQAGNGGQAHAGSSLVGKGGTGGAAGSGGKSGSSGHAGQSGGSGGSGGQSPQGGAAGAPAQGGSAGSAQGGVTGTSGGGTSGGGTSGGGTSGGGTTGGGGAVFPTDHPRITNATEQANLKAALASGTAAAMRFRDMVDSQLGGADVYDFQPWHAALLGLLTGDAKYCAYAIAQVDQTVTSEEGKIASGMAPDVAGDSYLHVGEYVANVALTYDYCFSAVTPDQRMRFIAYANQAVWNVWHADQATWGGNAFPWSGWSVDDPVDNYYFSFLRATMLLGLATRGENPQGDGWITEFRDTKLASELVPTYATDLVGGGSREGTGYGVAMAELFRLYDQWETTTTERIADLTPHTRASLSYMVHSILPTRDRVAPIGDQSRDSTAMLFDYQRDYMQVLGALYPSDPITEAMRGLLPLTSVPEMTHGFMYYSDFLYDTTGLKTRPLGDLYPGYYSPGTGHVFLRSGWDTTSTWVGLIGGPYTESHAHQDQGSILLYKNEWLAYDANVDSHSGIHQEADFHTLVRIDDGGGATIPMQQGSSSNAFALHDDAAYSYFGVDVTPVYAAGSGVSKVEREVVFVKPDVLVVYDRVSSTDATSTAVFQLQTPNTPSIMGNRIGSQGTKSRLDVTLVRPSSVSPVDVDWTTVDPDMLGGHRVDVAEPLSSAADFLSVFALDGAATTIAASDSGGLVGVTIALADGRTVVARFDPNAHGGTLAVTGGGMDVSTTLPQGVSVLPLLAQ